MQLTSENYYSQEANKEYMSVSGYKDFAGTYGKMPCEFYGMEKLNGRWEDEKSTALLVGSYVDSYFEGSLDQFKKDNPEIFTQKGELKSNFKQAEEIIARIERDEYFMKYMSGQKQVIMTGELFGAKWKIKMDSYIPGVAIVDLKVMASITDLKWVKDIGYLDFVRYWGYDIQGAVYQEIVRQNTGEKLPFFIAGATKQTEPDIRIIHVTDNYLQEALHMVEMNMPRILRVKNGEVYDYDRLEKVAHDLHWEETEENEILLINLHNQLVWHLYRFDKDPRADAILYAVIEAILGEKAADITDVPWELRCVWEGGKRANVFE